MMKHYKKFYEVDNNRYYTIVADDEMYIANESFLRLGRKKLFGNKNELITGLKLLKFSPSIAKLFNALANLKPTKKQKYDSDDLVTYVHIDNDKLKESIKKSYTQAIDDEIKSVKHQIHDLNSQGKFDLVKSCENYIQELKNVNPMAGIDIDTPEHTGCMIIKTMLREGLEHLYTEQVNGFTKNVYLYEQDEFGTLTIYRLTTIKNVVKTIDTFIYDKKLVESLLKTLYEEGR